MSQKENVKTMVGVSIGILVMGLFSGAQIFFDLFGSVSGTKDLYVDNTDFTLGFKFFGTLAALALAAIPVVISIIIVIVQWIVYGIVSASKHKKEQNK